MTLPLFIQETRTALRRSPARIQEAVARAAAAGGTHDTLHFGIEKQLQTLWCWAAVSTSVIRFFDPATTWTQCRVAEAEMRAPCCVDGGTANCNRVHFLERALTRTGTLLDFTDRAFDFGEVRAEISSRRAPLGCRIGWRGGSGHFVVIDGLSETAGKEEVDVKDPDPLYASSTHLYDEFANRYRGSGTWTHSYQTERATALGGTAAAAPRTPGRRVRTATN
jgi:Papain-like cysteine protease AvrRpt2